jgi:hypothetical protein
MSADGSTVIEKGLEAADAPRRPRLNLSRPDFSKPLVWNTPDDSLEEFHWLVKNPPLHSVVIHIGPKMAESLLKLSNTRNRPQTKSHYAKISRDIAAQSYELTGDTLKFSKKAVLMDGQHRLLASIRSKEPLLTHVVFGLDGELFDVLDQGKKRSAGDVLSLCGVKDHALVAGAIVWVLKLTGEVMSVGGGGIYHTTTPRKVRELALGPMRAISDYVKDARLINIAYKHPPTMVAALLFLIGKRNSSVARDFAHEWVHGAKIGRNKNFDVLNQRIMAVAHQNAGAVNHAVRAALLIQTFNYWHAGIVASPRALTWKRGWTFPSLEFDKDRFTEGKKIQDRENTSLDAVKYRVHLVLTKMQDKHCEAHMTQKEISDLANVSPGSVSYVLSELCKSKQISQIRGGKKGAPASYRVNTPAAEILEAAVDK